MKERILCRKVMAWLMTAFMVITCLISIGGKNTAYAAAMENIKDRKSTRLNSSHTLASRMPSSA